MHTCVKTQARVLPSGGLEFDRRWQLVDLDGRVVNAKRTAAFHPIRAEFDLAHKLISLSRWADPPHAAAATFPLVPGRDGPCEWLSDALGIGVLLEERPDGGFPDDRDAAGPTLVSTASLAEVARWFGFDLAESRRRFRAGSGPRTCASGAWRQAATAGQRPSRPTSATPSKPGGAGACGRLDVSAWGHFYRLGVHTFGGQMGPLSLSCGHVMRPIHE